MLMCRRRPGPEFFLLKKTGRSWEVRQIIKDPEGDKCVQLRGGN